MDDAGREDVGVEASQPPQPMPPWMATAQRAADAAAAAEITKVASNNGALLSDAPREASLLNLKELPRTGKRGAPQAFPHLLFLMLERESSDVIRWTQEGRAFMISDLSAFIANTLMKYFRHSRYASFQRQLNLYGFRKNESGAFEHKFFVRENPELLTKVQRSPQPSKSGSRSKKGSGQSAPTGGEDDDMQHKSSSDQPQLKNAPSGRGKRSMYQPLGPNEHGLNSDDLAKRQRYAHGNERPMQPPLPPPPPPLEHDGRETAHGWWYAQQHQQQQQPQQKGQSPEHMWRMMDQGRMRPPMPMGDHDGAPPMMYVHPADDGARASGPQKNVKRGKQSKGRNASKGPPSSHEDWQQQQQPPQYDDEYQQQRAQADEASARRYAEDPNYRNLRHDEATAAAALGSVRTVKWGAPPLPPPPNSGGGYGHDLERSQSMPAIPSYYPQYAGDPYGRGPPQQYGWEPSDMPPPATPWAQYDGTPSGAKGGGKRQSRQSRKKPPVGPIALGAADYPPPHPQDDDDGLHGAGLGEAGHHHDIATGLTPTGLSPTGSDAAFFNGPISPAYSLTSLPSFCFADPNEEGRAAVGTPFSLPSASGRSRRPGFPPEGTDDHPPVGDYYQQHLQYQRGGYHYPSSAMPRPHQPPMRGPPKQRAKGRKAAKSEKDGGASSPTEQELSQQALEAATAAAKPEHAHVTFAPDVSLPPAGAASSHHRSRALNRLNSEDETSLLRRSISLSSDDWTRGLDDTAEVVNTLCNFSRSPTGPGEHAYEPPAHEDAGQPGEALDRHDIEGIFEAHPSFEGANSFHFNQR